MARKGRAVGAGEAAHRAAGTAVEEKMVVASAVGASVGWMAAMAAVRGAATEAAVMVG